MNRRMSKIRTRAVGLLAGNTAWIIPAVFLVLAMGQPVPATDSPSKSDARVLSEEITYTVKKNDRAEYTVRRRIAILNERGKRYTFFSLSESDFRKLKRFNGKVLGPNGQLIYSYEKKDGRRDCGFMGYSLYDDICFRKFVLSCNAYPFTIEYEFTIEHKTLLFWPDWQPMRDVPVLQSTYDLVVPESFTFTTKAIGAIGNPQVTQQGHTNRYRWELSNLPALKKEDHSPDNSHGKPVLRFAPDQFALGKYDIDGQSWQSLAASSYAMYEDKLKLLKSQAALVEALSTRVSTARELCDSLHKSLLARSRYVAIEIGIGGWEPSKSAETFSRGYGDCKDLSTMYVSMLRHAGIEAKPALLRMKTSGVADPEFPKLYFNHMIFFSIIDGDTVWTDPTHPGCKFGDLPWWDEGIFVLAVDAENGDIVRTPPSTAEDNVVARSGLIEMTGSNSISVSLDFTMTGNSSHDLHSLLLYTPKREIDQLLKDRTYGLTDVFTTDSASIICNDPGRSKVGLHLSGIVRNAIQSVGKKHYLDLTFLSLFTDDELIDLAERTQGINLRYSRSFVDTLILQIPSGWNPVEIPENVNLSDEFGELRISYALVDDRVIVCREKKMRTYRVAPEELGEYKTHLEEFRKI